MRGRAILLAVALLFSIGVTFMLAAQPTGIMAQDSPLFQETSPLLPGATDATETPQPAATAPPTVEPTVTPTASPSPTQTSPPQTSPTRTATSVPTPTAVARASSTPTTQALAAAPTAQGSAESLDLEQFDAFIQAALAAYNVPGAVVAVVDGDEVIFAEGYGVRRLGDSAAVDENTRFQIASASKFLLASTVAALVDAGLVELDRPVVEYLPEFGLYDAYAGEHTTLRDLLAHRTGLPANTGDLLDRMGFDRATALNQLRFLPPAVSFREREGYSNLGFFAAGEVIDVVEDKPWEEIVAERIFTPLGMTRSSGYLDVLLEDDNVAAPHLDLGDGLVVTEWKEQPILGAASQTVSTLADLTAWVRMLLAEGVHEGEPILEPASVEALFAPAIVGGGGGPLQDPLGARCLGCDTYRYLGNRIIEKAGSAPGARSLLLLAPDQNLGLIVLANRNLTAFPEAVRAEFLEEIFGPAGRNLQAVVRAQQSEWNATARAPIPPDDPLEPSLALTGYDGEYANDFYGAWTITSVRGADRLEVAAGLESFPGQLQPFDGDTFLLTWNDPGFGAELLTFQVEEDVVTGFSTTTSDDFVRVGP